MQQFKKVYETYYLLFAKAYWAIQTVISNTTKQN